jgi:hypothetical protein
MHGGTNVWCRVKHRSADKARHVLPLAVAAGGRTTKQQQNKNKQQRQRHGRMRTSSRHKPFEHA